MVFVFLFAGFFLVVAVAFPADRVFEKLTFFFAVDAACLVACFGCDLSDVLSPNSARSLGRFRKLSIILIRFCSENSLASIWEVIIARQ